MIDQNKFINTYIDIVIGNLTEQIKTNLQLQTQLKLTNDLILERDANIALMTKKAEETAVLEDWKAKYESLEKNYTAVVNKVSHMETLLNQLSEMKRTLLSKNEEIAKLQSQFTKKVINRKAKKSNEDIAKVESKESDDF